MNKVADQPASVLIVDDEESVRRYVDRILTLAGYRTRVALDCAHAIAAASLERFDLLLTDVMMPEMSGAQLAATLRHADPDLKVLYLTGHADQLFKEKPSSALDAREAFLEKPCGATALQQAVSLAITGSITSPTTLAPPSALPRGDEKLRHDFTNQLAIIRGFAEILVREAGPGDVRRQDFEEIHKAALVALDLLERMWPEQRRLEPVSTN
jgi:two-component system cell cycle response regulator CpdR